MKNKLKLYLTLWVVLFTFLNVNAQCETIMKFFKDDVYTSKELVAFAEKDPQKAFDSWKVLYNKKNSLTKNLEELDLVSKNLDKIKSAGGYLKWKELNVVGNELTPLLLKSGEEFTILTNARKLPGTSTGNGKNIVGTWLRGTERNAGLFPKSVADKMKGKSFTSFDDFRQQFWKAVADEPSLASQFDANSIQRMQGGLAPFTNVSQQIGGLKNYVLHHKTPINQGGAVYDMDNLYIVTPKYHKEILDPAYHYGYGY